MDPYRSLPPPSIRFFAPIDATAAGELACRYAHAIVTAELELCLVAERATVSAAIGKFHELAGGWGSLRHRLLKVPAGPYVNVVMSTDYGAWRRLWTLPVDRGCERNVLIVTAEPPETFDVVLEEVVLKYDLLVAATSSVGLAWRAYRSVAVVPPDEPLMLRGVLL